MMEAEKLRFVGTCREKRYLPHLGLLVPNPTLFQNQSVKVTFIHAILKISEAMRASRGKLLKDRNKWSLY